MDSDVKIVILQRGWIFVGNFSQDGSTCRLTNASNIRRWGTSKGLGELAENGPTKNTELDKVGTVTFHELTTIAILNCDQAIWSKQLSK